MKQISKTEFFFYRMFSSVIFQNKIVASIIDLLGKQFKVYNEHLDNRLDQNV